MEAGEKAPTLVFPASCREFPRFPGEGALSVNHCLLFLSFASNSF
jgi:hypothetical protein